MFSVFSCIVYSHDIRLVLLAALTCAAGAHATIRLVDRSRYATSIEKAAWLLMASIVAGASIWCVHFIAMLGYDPGTPIGFDLVLTIMSLMVAIVGAAIGLTLATSQKMRFAPAFGGAIVGLAIIGMHYTGMMGYRVQGIVSWDKTFLAASILLATAFTAASLHLTLAMRIKNRRLIASGLLVVGIIGLHFTGMTAFRVEPLLVEGSFSNPEAMLTLAVAISFVALVIVTAGFASQMIGTSARTEASEALVNMSNGLLMVAPNLTIRLYNNRVREMFGLEREQLKIGMPLQQYLEAVGSKAGWDEARTKRVFENHVKWMAADSTERLDHHFENGNVFSIVCRPLPEGGAVITYDDVTEAREGQKMISHMAFHDALTGLANRRSLADKTGKLSGTQSYAMLLVDLDRFKAVNDMLGHGVGDQLLIEVSKRLLASVGDAGTAFRIGGDELAVLTEADADVVRSIGQKIVDAISSPFEIDGHTLSIGCSIGVAFADTLTGSEVVQQMADLALYKAKENGRGRIEFYCNGMIENAASRRQLERELVAATAAKQFEMHYQPLYALPDKTLVGFEALLRWNNPARGMVSPAEFIPVAEQTGAIVEIGAWVIDEACRQAALWPSDTYVSINISPVQLRAVDILKQLTAALDRHGITPSRIEVEITETAMVDSSDQVRGILAGLRALGVRIAMDDFGTGYSSLAHLREFDLDRIKIDRSFINASGDDAGAAAVVRAVTGMAADLRIATTGEGVETAEQLQNLVALGCGTAQGYHLGKPLTATAATELVAGSDKPAEPEDERTAA